MSPCTHGHGLGIIYLEILPVGILHGAGGIIGITAHTAQVRYGNVIKRMIHCVSIVPLAVLQPQNTFIIDHIGICTAQSCRWENAVIVQYKTMTGGGIGNPPCHLDCRLVIAVQEIYLESGYTHSGIVAHHCLKLFIHTVEYCPQYKLYATLTAILDKSRQVQFRHRLHQEPLVNRIPTLIQHHVFQTVTGCKIYVVLIRTLVYSRFEIHTFQPPVIPPFPC